jgi:DNA polymerase-3 subunit epsilon
MEIPRIIKENKFAVLDTETTGLSRKLDQIIQLAIIQIDYGSPRFRTIVQCKPTCEIKPGAAKVHGITAERLALAPRFESVANEITDFIGERCLLGYNILKFDWPILSRQYAESAMAVPSPKLLDVLKFERKYGGEGKHDLATAVQRWGVTVNHQHEALEDCRATWAVFVAIARQQAALGDASLLQAIALQEE